MKQSWFVMSIWLASAGAAVFTPGPDVHAGGPVQQVPDTLERHQVHDINLHEPQELRRLLQRLDELAGTPHPAARRPRIALVLHGPEIEFFSIGRYTEYRDMVDQAARLDAFGVIEVKACRTRMDALGLDDDDLPGFIEIVPFGPAEVERLEREEGYVRM